MQKRLKHYVLAAMLLLAPMTASAQVTIGNGEKPADFSVLELVSNDTRGLRLPQIATTNQRDEIFTTEEEKSNPLAQGLQIFNMETRCVETWNGSTWIQQCPPGGPYVEPITVIPDGTGASNWTATNRWVGAFWRNDQTGERIIRATTLSSTKWSVKVDDNCKDWITLDYVRKNNDKLWTDDPGDAEDYKILDGVSKLPEQTGHVLFRIGTKGTNLNPLRDDYKNPDGSISRKPRYGTITLTINKTDYILYMRQGEAADYVFDKEEPMNGGTTTATGKRDLAAKFSPYNLTDTYLNDTDVFSHQTDYQDGKFVEFPTQAGAYWMWGTDLTRSNYSIYLRRAYHPTKLASEIRLAGNGFSFWDNDYTYNANNDTWDEFTDKSSSGGGGIDERLETCPNGWRRPKAHFDDYTDTAPANGSELVQSLFYTTFDGTEGNRDANNYRYLGYYADGFFDRRSIVNTPSGGRGKSAVSITNKDIAHQGLLFTNPDTDASLFTPYTGLRRGDDPVGELISAGVSGEFWSSSVRSLDYSKREEGWSLSFSNGGSFSGAAQPKQLRTTGLAIRCVVAEE